MRLIFHLSRFTCQVPSANVKIGTMPRRIIVGLSKESFFALYAGAAAVAVDSVRLQFAARGFLSNCRRHEADERIPRPSPVQLDIADSVEMV